MSAAQSDALVLFGATGDLARKMVFPALYEMARQGDLTARVVGVAGSDLTPEKLRETVAQSIHAASASVDTPALETLQSRLSYVSGDYRDGATFTALKQALGGAQRPAFYLAIPPSLFETVIEGLGSAGLSGNARIIIEKPFGRDLQSARALDSVAQNAFDADSIFRIDHYLGKEAIMNLLYFRFANSFLEPIWNCDNIASVQITLAERFGVGSRGAFYETAGCLRDVVQNHLFQVVALLAMEPPQDQNYGCIHDGKARLFRAMRPLAPEDVVRGQYEGYRAEANVDPASDVETFCALRLFIDSPRWRGVPWYLRSGKSLAVTATEVVVMLKPPRTGLFDDAGADAESSNYIRFRLSPSSDIALAARVKRPGKGFLGDQRELYLLEADHPEGSPYARLLGDAMAGDGALFTREDAVEAAWAVVQPVLDQHDKVHPYAQGSWGPKAADAVLAEGTQWRNPVPEGHDAGGHGNGGQEQPKRD